MYAAKSLPVGYLGQINAAATNKINACLTKHLVSYTLNIERNTQNTKEHTMSVIVEMRAKVFGKIAPYKMLVETDGTVRVYDSTAGYYTLCHSLCDSARRRAVSIARSDR